MGKNNCLIDIAEAKEILNGDNNQDKISYLVMIGRTMVYINEQKRENLQDLIKLMTEHILVENDKEVKEEIFMALSNIALLNNYEYVKKPFSILIDKLELLESDDLAEALLVISNTFQVEYLDLMNKYKEYPDKYVKEIVNDAIDSLNLKSKN